jgi:hypothetical protein
MDSADKCPEIVADLVLYNYCNSPTCRTEMTYSEEHKMEVVLDGLRRD